MNIEDQKSVMNCFKTVQQLWDEAELMAERLLDLLEQSYPGSSGQIIDSKVQYGYEDESSEEFVYTDTIRTLSIQKTRPGRKSKKADAYFGFQLSFMGDGCDIPGNESPLLHMFYVESFEPDFDDELYFGFPGDYQEYTIEADRIAVHRKEGKVVDCFYSLRFLSMSNEHQLKKYCVDPLINIVFHGEEVTKALPDNFFEEVLVKLPDIKELSDDASLESEAG